MRLGEHLEGDQHADGKPSFCITRVGAAQRMATVWI